MNQHVRNLTLTFKDANFTIPPLLVLPSEFPHLPLVVRFCLGTRIMKHRITLVTYKTEDDSGFKWDKKSLQLRSLRAAREDKLSFALQELPSPLRELLAQFKELCIRWDYGISIGPWSMRDPFASRLPQGLHVHSKPSEPQALNTLCSFLKTNVGPSVRCFNNEEKESFTEGSKWRYFYDPIQSKHGFLDYLVNNMCHIHSARCKKKVLELEQASYIDFNFDSASEKIDLHAFWTQAPSNSAIPESERSWEEHIEHHEDFEKTEVGIFERAPDTERFDITLGGHYAIVGKADELSPMLFSFPSRHHSLPFSSSFNCSFNQPTGLHPKLKCDVNVSNRPHATCKLHSFFDVPQPFFVDPYQLADDSVVQSMGIKYVQDVNGETDLEAPLWTVSKWGATVLAEIDTGKEEITTNGTKLTMEMPLHLRYLEPKEGKRYTETSMPWPIVFWACDGEGIYNPKAKNPFGRYALGYDDLFPSDNVFYHFRAKDPTRLGLQSKIDVPILDLKEASIIETWTIRVVLGGFLLLLVQIVLGVLRVKKTEETASKEGKSEETKKEK